MSVTSYEPPAPPVGIIESLASGFETVAERLSLVLLPLLLDLLIWAGPRIMVQPAFEAFYDDLWLPLLEQQPEEQREQFEAASGQFDTLVHDLAPFYLPLVTGPIGGMVLLRPPGLVAGQPVTALPFDFEPPVWEIHSMLTVIGLTILVPVAGMMVGIMYRSMVAQQVRDNELHFIALLQRMPGYWLNLLGFMALLVILAMVVITPFVLVGAFLSLIGQQLGLLAITAGVFVLIWLGVFVSFTVQGVLMNGRWALAALWDSVRLVQWNLSSTTLLWLAVVGLNVGLSFLFDWAGLTTNTWYVIPGIGVHAFVSTALIAATYVYFKDRYRHWSETRAILLERLNQMVERREQPSEDSFEGN